MEPVTDLNGAGPHGSAPPRGFLGVLHRIEGAMTALAALAIFAMAVYICYGILARNVLNISVSDETVIVGELMIIALVLPLARVAAERGFIAVEVLTQRFAARFHVALLVLTVVIGLLAALPIAYSALRAFIGAWSSGNFYFGILNLPEWPGKLAFLIGYIFFVLRLLILLVTEARTPHNPEEVI
ncbi:TRAP transporter small permease [Sulfitobacter sp. F26169L]|uniref:TRAP transporter small permease n=1 Tax=Sulfitobacter sp. F26169L TaxID=2996015 RepID=UPI002260A55B|nr:TRAP transporter small permease [Sulfitobacter sp. F26169L]MCX7568101.1 TRAP transporter small permease [Sulfitobacter sp. F26169L]